MKVYTWTWIVSCATHGGDIRGGTLDQRRRLRTIRVVFQDDSLFQWLRDLVRGPVQCHDIDTNALHNNNSGGNNGEISVGRLRTSDVVKILFSSLFIDLAANQTGKNQPKPNKTSCIIHEEIIVELLFQNVKNHARQFNYSRIALLFMTFEFIPFTYIHVLLFNIKSTV